MIPDDEGNEIDYHSCPQLFIGSTIWDFMERLEYLDKYPHTAPAYDEQDARFASAKRYYLGKLNEYESLVRRDG